MNQEPRRHAIKDGRKNEEKSGNHSEESIRPVRYAKGIYCSRVSVRRAARALQTHQRRASQREAATADYLAPASALLSRVLRRFAVFR